MRMGTLVAGVLVMAAGFGLAALQIGWPVLVAGAPFVFGGVVVVLFTYLDAMQKEHARQYRYAQAQQQWAAATAWDGGPDAGYDEPPAWTGYRPRQDEDTLDSEELLELIRGVETEAPGDSGAAEPGSTAG
ncbi:hypothetical protein ACQEVB_28365 [Pseudonocardia sp. CA-107938]|uniref:hypothetical protein n=1 Tax=Pseudonocardia sp. CA-107938 TaxID=3240021 RepID=UPI003D9157BD